jgi:hypothetical protein
VDDTGLEPDIVMRAIAKKPLEADDLVDTDGH